MRIRQITTALAIAILIMACNFPGLAPAQSANTNSNVNNPAETASPIPAVPTFTEIPLSPTPAVPQVTSNTQAVNCRLGPDVGYDAVSSLSQGQFAQITGRNDDSSWWYIADPNHAGAFCWVAASVVTTSGDLSNIPLVASPPGVVTKVTVNVTVSYTACGGPNPLDYSGTITTNGPVKVTYQWELRGDLSHTTPPDTLVFKAAGTKKVPDPGADKADCGHYNISLHVLSPNDISAKKNFSIP